MSLSDRCLLYNITAISHGYSYLCVLIESSKRERERERDRDGYRERYDVGTTLLLSNMIKYLFVTAELMSVSYL